MAGGALNINASNGTLEKSDLPQDETFQIKEEPDIAMETSQIQMLDSESEDEFSSLVQTEPEDLHNPKK